ncbi:hypothetical protein LCGC14_1972650, partial [marine sediment metagenome]
MEGEYVSAAVSVTEPVGQQLFVSIFNLGLARDVYLLGTEEMKDGLVSTQSMARFLDNPNGVLEFTPPECKVIPSVQSPHATWIDTLKMFVSTERGNFACLNHDGLADPSAPLSKSDIDNVTEPLELNTFQWCTCTVRFQVKRAQQPSVQSCVR